MPLNIQDSEGKTVIKVDDNDAKKDVIVNDAGQETPLDEAALAKEREAKEVNDEDKGDKE